MEAPAGNVRKGGGSGPHSPGDGGERGCMPFPKGQPLLGFQPATAKSKCGPTVVNLPIYYEPMA